MALQTNLPETMRALVLRSTEEDPTIETIPTPQPTLGSAVVHVIAANTISYIRDIYNGKRQYPFPKPLVPGISFIGRVAAVGPDATKMKNGDLVLVDPLIRSRDNPSDAYLAGIHQGGTEGSKKLMTKVFRDWSYAEYCRAPIENLHILDEARLTSPKRDGGLGHSLARLGYLFALMVPYGGLKDIEFRAGQTIIVAPATGPFGGAAVAVALAMGAARVIAMGRNKDSLAFLKSRVTSPERVETVPITGDMIHDCKQLKQFGSVDAFFDIGPPEAYASTHFKSAILALRHGARISIMGGYKEDVAIPHNVVMHMNMRIYGKWMYEREDIPGLLSLIESGLLDLSIVDVTGEYNLDQWKEAWDGAAENAKFGQITIIKP